MRKSARAQVALLRLAPVPSDLYLSSAGIPAETFDSGRPIRRATATNIPVADGTPPPGLSPDCEQAWRIGFRVGDAGWRLSVALYELYGPSVPERIVGCYDAGYFAGQKRRKARTDEGDKPLSVDLRNSSSQPMTMSRRPLSGRLRNWNR